MPPAPADFWDKGSQVWHRLRTYYVKETPTPLPPPICQRTAVCCALLFTLFYVAPFYLSPTLRSSPAHSRNTPAVIRARVRAVGLTCIACTLVTVYFLAIYGHATPRDVLRLCGYWPFKPLDILKVLLLVVILFTCSLYESLIVDADWRQWSPSAFKQALWDDWIGFRNLIVAPVSEEVVFRAVTIPLFLLADTTPVRVVFLTPLIFGMAHLHHLADFLQSRTPAHQRLPPLNVFLQGVAISAFQFIYTSVFGFFAAFVFLRTGNVWAAIVAHSFCNQMGLPRLWGRVGQYDSNLTPPRSDAAQGKRSENGLKVGNDVNAGGREEAKAALVDHPVNLGVGWTVMYYFLVAVGAFAFYKLLLPLTESKHALARF